jgi:hypothetical protein
MLLANLDQITPEYLRNLCADSCPETSTLEFKLTLPAPGDNQELMKDICALANADGGDLVYGIAEVDGAASAVKPLDGTTVDRTTRRITQVIDNVEPRIHGVQVHPITIDDGVVIVARVPASFDGPHSYRVGEARRYVLRNGRLTADMSVDQIRIAYDRTASLAERAREFIGRRLKAIAERKTWRPVKDGPVAVAIVVPLAGLAGRASVNIAELSKNYTRYVHQDWGGASRNTNLDGLVVHPGGGTSEDAGRVRTFTQIYRNGTVEAVRFGGLTFEDRPVIPGATMVRFYRDSLAQALEGLRAMGASGPVVIQLAMVTVGAFTLPADHFTARRLQDMSRSDLVLPDLWVNELGSIRTPEEIDALLRPAMDVLWQAFDFERCFEFDRNGKFAPRP